MPQQLTRPVRASLEQAHLGALRGGSGPVQGHLGLHGEPSRCAERQSPSQSLSLGSHIRFSRSDMVAVRARDWYLRSEWPFVGKRNAALLGLGTRIGRFIGIFTTTRRRWRKIWSTLRYTWHALSNIRVG